MFWSSAIWSSDQLSFYSLIPKQINAEWISILCFANNICIFPSLDVHGETGLFYLNELSQHNAFLLFLQNIRKTWMNSSTEADTPENQFN